MLHAARKLILGFLTFVCMLQVSAQRRPLPIERIEGSPYPASRKPDTLFIIDDTRLSAAQQLVVQSLQGLLAIYKPQIYRVNNEGSLMWMSEMHSRYGVYINDSYINDYVGLVKQFEDSLDGYILCSMTSSSANAAIMLSSIYNTIAVPDSLEKNFKFLKKVMDAREMTEEDVYAKYHDSLSQNVLVYQNEAKEPNLGDYAVFTNALTLNQPLNDIFTQSVFKNMQNPAVLFGWGSEHDLVTAASKNSMMVHAADLAKNLSTLTNFRGDTKYNQPDGQYQLDSTNPNVHTVCFLMTDGDNIQWLINSFATSKEWYNADDRGNFPLGWTLSPALCEIAPPAFKYIYDNASNGANGRDYFVAAPSGLGYFYPENYPQLLNNTQLLDKYLDKTDMHIVNVIGNRHNPDLSAYTQLKNIDAIFYYTYGENYTGLNGKIMWSNNKPIIGARYALWGDKTQSQVLAQKLNAEVKNQFQPEGYSLIPVHVWTQSVEDVKKCISLLDGDVRVVAPDDFVRLIENNLGVFLYPNYPNPFTDHTTITFKLNYSQQVNVRIVDASGAVVKVLFDGLASPGITKLDFVKDQAMTNGPYACTLTTASQVKSIQIDTY
jgi:hypothetical protein